MELEAGSTKELTSQGGPHRAHTHYRPKGEVEGVVHPGYWWLAMEWTNLVPSCIDCNRRRNQQTPDPEAGTMVRIAANGDFVRGKRISTGKASVFPLIKDSPRASVEVDDINAEQRLLLDPTQDDPDAHLVFHVNRQYLISVVYPKAIDSEQAPTLPETTSDPSGLLESANRLGVSTMGAVSIQTYGLNRLSLVQARTRKLRDLEFLLEIVVGLSEIAAELDRRINERAAAIGIASADEATRLEADQTFEVRIRDKVTHFRGRMLAQMRAASDSTAPYAALVRAWIRAYLAET